MMMSPESFYEYYLKGKTTEQIMTCIRRLKREIGHCKKQLECPLSNEMMVDPGPDVVLWATRLYLERAKQALQEAGGEYIPTAKEILAQQLKEDFHFIQQFVFTIGGYFGGFQTYTVCPKQFPYYTVAHSQFDTEEQRDKVLYSEDEFQSMLDEIHLEEWKHHYNDPYVCDGTQWELTVSFNNGRRAMTWAGNNAFPPDFDKLEEFFGCLDDNEEDESNDED